MSILKVDTINEKTTGNGVYVPGHIVQVQHANITHSSDFTVTTANTWTDIGLSDAITPVSTNSKVIVTVHFAFRILHTTANQIMRGGFRVLRGSTTVWNTSNYDEIFQIRESGTEWNDVMAFRFVDSPATTNATTYKVQGILKSGTGLRIYNYTRGGQIILEELAQ